eukprot:CAMPEP_0195298710 /NCGR_PEP_ID=MMETSP0707-20130614/24063_1 /TAXON_ID=33640 /ORGANISM="Asterionellopsis glacialis, Strain CCMP134" /LENGTH=523 /DNA_ID=CAMNT_0040360911 /DNA_START=15 /DNA_END=1586 /DNA_ORIENTATION=-
MSATSNSDKQPAMTPEEAQAAAAKAIAAMRIGLTKSPPVSPPATPFNKNKASSSRTTNSTESPTSTLSTSKPTLECDYDVNPTYLYQAIEARQWDVAIKYIMDDDDDDKADTNTSPAQEAATWVTRKETNGKLRWRLLPIHAAVIFKAPVSLLEHLLEEYPAAAQCKDDQGMLPLHLAFRNAADWPILEELLTAYPQGIHTKDRKGRTPIQCASSQNKKQISVLELYTHIVATSERTKATHASNELLNAKVSVLQETHSQAIERMKEDYELRMEKMAKAYEERIEILEHSKNAKESIIQEYNTTLGARDVEIEHKAATENELTQKLQITTQALSKVLESQSQQQKQTKEAVLRQCNTELLEMVHTLLKQQETLKTKLDEQTVKSHEQERHITELLKQYNFHRSQRNDFLSKDRITMRVELEDSQKQLSAKLKSVERQLMDLDAPRAQALAVTQPQQQNNVPLEQSTECSSMFKNIEKSNLIYGSTSTAISSLTKEEKKDDDIHSPNVLVVEKAEHQEVEMVKG